MNQPPYGYRPPPPPPQYGYGYQPPPQVVYVQTQLVKAPFSHGGHIVLDILSCGMWIPLHLIIWACH